MRRSCPAVQLRYGSDADDGAAEIAGHKRYARGEYHGQCSVCEYPSVCHVQLYGKSGSRGGDSSRAGSAYSYAMYSCNHRSMGAGKPYRSYWRTARAQ